MPAAKKKASGKLLKKRVTSTVVVVESRISAKETLFPEKITKAKKILRNTKFDDSIFRP